VTVHAHVAPAPPSTGGTLAPTGTVQFAVGGTNVGNPVPVDVSGNAVLSGVDLPEGNAPFGAGGETFTGTYSGDGNFLGSNASATQLPDAPVATASDGTNLWEVDEGANSVVERNLTTGASSVLSGGSYGFAAPQALTLAAGRVFVVNEANNTVTVLDATTRALIEVLSGTADGFDFGTTLTPQDIATDGTNVFVANPTGNSISIINASSLSVNVLTQTIGEPWAFGDPLAITVGNGDVFVAGGPDLESANGNLIEFDASTDQGLQWLTVGGSSLAVSGKYLWMANSTDLMQFSGTAGVIYHEKISEAMPGVADLLTVGTNVWVSQPDSNDLVEVSGGTGAVLQTLSSATFGFDHPYELSFDGKHLWVTNLFGQSLTKLTAAGALVEIYAPAPSFTSDTPGALAAVGTPYSYTYTASEPGVKFVGISGALPAGLKLNATSGLLSGIPTKPGSYSFSVVASDPEGASAPVSSIINVMGPGDPVVADSGDGVVADVPAGRLAFTIGSGMADPFGVAVDNSGDVYVSDYVNSDVVKIPANGGPQSTVSVGGGLANPEGLAVDAKGDLFIADTGNNRVVEVSSGGGSQTTVGIGLNAPTGVAVDAEGDVFIADFGGGVVVKVPAGGGPQTTVGSGFSYPDGVAVDTSGDVYVSDQGQSSVVKVPAKGAQSFVGSGFSSPFAVALDPKGDLFVADYGNDRVAEIVHGIVNTLHPLVNHPAGVAVFAPAPSFTAGTPGSLAAVGTAYGYTYKAIAPAGEPKPVLRLSGSLPPGLTFDATTGLLSGTPTASGSYTFSVAAGNAATAAIATSTVVVLGVGDVVANDNTTGHVLDVPAGGGTPLPLAFSGLSGPGSVTVDVHGDVFVTDGGRVVELPATGAAQQIVASGLNAPEGIGTDAKGDVFVDNTGVGQVDEIPAGGSGATLVASGFTDPTGVAADLAGDLYVADDGGGTVYEVPAGGAGPGTPVGSGFSSPSDVAVSPTGTLYVTDQAQGGVVVLAPGKPQSVRGSGLNNPYAVAVGATGNLVLADYGNARLALITPAGTTSTLASGLAPTGVAVYAPPPVFTTSGVVPAGTVGTAYTYTYTATVVAGEAKAKFGVASGKLPPGLKLATTGTLSGTPTASGSYTFTVKAYNGASGTLDVPTTITVN
jgi:sugar lactone lactonase YvrE